MRRPFLTTIASLALLGCGDDIPDQTPTSEGSSTGSASTGTTGSPTTDTPMPTTSSDETTAGSDSTGPGAVCGNGELEPGEDCDDDNILDDDSCYSNCTIPYEVLWTQTFDDGEDDFATDAMFDAEGNLYVLGSSQTAGEDSDVWLRQYLPDGRTGWTWTYDGTLGGDDFGRRMAWHPSGDLTIVGTEQTDQGDDVLVVRLELAGQTVVWSQTVDGPDMGTEGEDDDFANAVTTDADGNVLVAATVRQVDQEWDAWLRKYDADGNEIWTVTHDEAMFSDSSDAVLVDAAGDIYLVGVVEVANNQGEGWVRKLDTDGNIIWTNSVPGVLFSNAALDLEDNLVIAGFDIMAATVDIWVGRYDPDFMELGTTTFGGSSGAGDFGRTVAVGSGGDVYVGGSIAVTGEQAQIWAGRYLPNLGDRRWRHEYGNERANLVDEALGIAVSDDESRVGIVGFETVLGQGTNVWVRMLQNNPAPLL
ncbi:MAG: hypothetical protein AB1Z98_24955 [Nannocystaceae bacterium]